MVRTPESPSITSDSSSGVTARTDSSLYTADSSSDKSINKAMVTVVDEDDDYDAEDDTDDDADTTQEATRMDYKIVENSSNSSSIKPPKPKKPKHTDIKSSLGDTGSSSSMRVPEPDLGLKSVMANLAEAMRSASSTIRSDELRARELAEELRIANIQRQEEALTDNQTIHQINQSASLQIGKSTQKVIEVE
jgi:hypothetical protein